MSAYSDWKCGAMTDEEFRSHEAWEARRDEYLWEKKMAEYDDVEDEEDE